MIYLGLGSNTGDREAYLRQAVIALAKHEQITVKGLSAIYETQPVGYLDQPLFLNGVLAVESSLDPHALLAVCLNIEAELGRVRDLHWGPRKIDIDLLLYDEVDLVTPDLIIPHPLLHNRPFVLVPLKELSGEQIICQGKTAAELLAQCEPAAVNFYGRF